MGREKQPYYISGKQGLIAFAGLWDCWISPVGDELISFTVIVTDAAPSVSHIHPRMPVILPPERFASWLGETETSAPVRELEELIAGPKGEADMQFRPVSREVNSPANDAPDVLLAVESSIPGQDQGSLF